MDVGQQLIWQTAQDHSHQHDNNDHQQHHGNKDIHKLVVIIKHFGEHHFQHSNKQQHVYQLYHKHKQII